MFDQGPVNVAGAARGSRGRVLWRNGTLFVAFSATRVNAYSCPEEPTKTGEEWKAQTSAGEVRFTRRGCSSCGFSLGRLNPQRLISAAGEVMS